MELQVITTYQGFRTDGGWGVCVMFLRVELENKHLYEKPSNCKPLWYFQFLFNIGSTQCQHLNGITFITIWYLKGSCLVVFCFAQEEWMVQTWTSYKLVPIHGTIDNLFCLKVSTYMFSTRGVQSAVYSDCYVKE